jgi:CHAD domain-containing protein
LAFEFQSNRSVAKNVRRLVRREIARAIRTLRNFDDADSAEAVHDARTRLKRARALLALARPSLGSRRFRETNGLMRDAGRRISVARDAHVLRTAWSSLTAHQYGVSDPHVIVEVEAVLAEREERAQPHGRSQADLLDQVIELLERASSSIKSLRVSPGGWKLLSLGLRRTHRLARSAWLAALDDPSPECLHEWRKRVKGQMYQLRVLRPVRPKAFQQLAKSIQVLAELLGDDHDLVLLRRFLVEYSSQAARTSDITALLNDIDKRRLALRGKALHLGLRLYRIPPKRLVRWIEHSWKEWRGR